MGLVVLGGGLSGLSLALQAGESGLRVVLLEPSDRVAQPELIGQHGLDVRFSVAGIRATQDTVDGPIIVDSGGTTLRTQQVAVSLPVDNRSASPSYGIDAKVTAHISLDYPAADVRGKDVLVVGSGEDAAGCAIDLVQRGAAVVLAFGNGDPGDLSRLARRGLLRLEAERALTVLWRSVPNGVESVGGFPMVFFDDRRTPDLQFDHVVYRLGTDEPVPIGTDLDVTGEIDRTRLWWVSQHAINPPVPGTVVTPGRAWRAIQNAAFPEITTQPERPRVWRHTDQRRIDELRAEHYNATITSFERTHSDLWRIRIRPDHGDARHLPGQYASLGLGYWEPRADGARDARLDERWEKLVRRSYSISSRMFDSAGYLVGASDASELEFYIVLVPPGGDNVPGLTPRLATRKPGDRIYLGPRVAGRYTLGHVTDPLRQVVFLATGTGEAPHNAMIVELLRKGHRGSIVSAVTVRRSDDLAYLDEHRRLEQRYPWYHYLPLPTRDPDVPKRYIQDLIRSGAMEEAVGGPLDPATTDVYMCGNPGMIGLPTWGDDGEPVFTGSGVCELLHERGFTIDRRGHPGNVHYEEYW